jgi:glycosyltransferase involved in cell wall biosynthesis
MRMLPGLNIAIATTNHAADDKRIYRKIAVGLVQRGANVTIVTPSRRENFDGGKVKIVTYKKPGGLAGRIFAYRCLRKACIGMRPDIWIAPEPDSLGVVIKLARRNSGGVIFDCHEIYSQQLNLYRRLRWANGVVAPILKRLIGRVAAKADCILSVSPGVQASFSDVDAPKYIIRNCAWIQDFSEGRAARKARADAAGEFLIIQNGACGTLVGTTKLLEAMNIVKKLADVKLKVFELFEPGYEKKFHQLISSMGIEENVIVLPWMRPDEARGHIVNADAGVVLYQDELAGASLPNKLFDFMAAGIPFVVNKRSIFASELAEREGCGIAVDGGDPKAIAAGLVWLMEHPAEAREMGERGYQAFVARHSWEAELEKLCAIIEGIPAGGQVRQICHYASALES